MIFRRAACRYAALLAALALLLVSSARLPAQETNVPPKPNRYITDQAGVINAGTLDTINAQLDQFERQTSNQIVVAIYPSLPPETDIAQYTTYTYNAWQIGQKGKDNGALLLIAVNDHKMFICTGRGLEGALPDAICKNIVTYVIAPRFREDNYDGGVQAGVNAILAAAKGEYQGTGSTVYDRRGGSRQLPPWAGILIILIIIFIIANSRGGGGFGGPIIYSGGGWGGGYSGGGGGWGGGGGGGFSGGGGSSAGGGAGGSW